MNNEFYESDRKARECATKLLGAEPNENPITEGVKVFAFVAILPMLGLPLLNVPLSMIETPLLILGVLSGFAVWWYFKRKISKWSEAYARNMTEKNIKNEH